MTITSLSDLKAHQQRLADINPDRFLGTLLWFSIAGAVEHVTTTGNATRRSTVPVRVTHDQLAQWFTDLNLDPAFLPPFIAKVNAFRRASGETEHSFSVNTDENQRLFCVEIDTNPEYVLRHVHREIKNSRTQSTTYAHVATLKFLRGARSAGGKRHIAERYESSILTTLVELGLDNKPTGKKYPLSPVDLAHVEHFIKDFDARYTDLSANLTSNAIRAMVRDYVTSLNAIIVKSSGGVYFVHHSRQATLDSLQELVRRLGPGCSFHQVPLIDTDEQRSMLTDAFQTEVEDECINLLKQLAEVNEAAKKKGGKITAAQYVNLKSQWDAVVARSEEYTEVLGLAQGRAASAIDMALDQITSLVDNIDLGTKR